MLVDLMCIHVFGAKGMPSPGRAARSWRRADCDSGTQTRARQKQGIPATLLRLLLCMGAFASNAAPACGADAPRLEPWPSAVAGLWWVRAQRGDADASNRGCVSNLPIVRDGPRVWAIGSGPTRDFGRALDCVVQRDLGRPVSDVISPWPHPELVLGAAGLPRARHWAHADVARAMRTPCARCVSRLRQRLGGAASDLGNARQAVLRRCVCPSACCAVTRGSWVLWRGGVSSALRVCR